MTTMPSTADSTTDRQCAASLAAVESLRAMGIFERVQSTTTRDPRRNQTTPRGTRFAVLHRWRRP
jgi:hypothetical protein